jgi:hypothetical protein
MVLVRLYGNSWKWYISRRCFAEWIIRVDQFEEKSRKKAGHPCGKERRRASGKRTKNEQLCDCLFGCFSLFHLLREVRIFRFPVPPLVVVEAATSSVARIRLHENQVRFVLVGDRK